MSDDGKVTLVELFGVSPEEIPYNEDDPEDYDEARELAHDIYNLIREDYSFDVSGVQTVVDSDSHERYMGGGE